MLKKLSVVFVLLSLVTVLVAACGEGGGGSENANVYLGITNFTQSSITMSKGGSLTLVDNTNSVHFIQNGSWVNGAPRPVVESGAPIVNHQFNGNESYKLGPFNTSGTYHLYCTIHPGMNLTVIIQ